MFSAKKKQIKKNRNEIHFILFQRHVITFMSQFFSLWCNDTAAMLLYTFIHVIVHYIVRMRMAIRQRRIRTNLPEGKKDPHTHTQFL